MKSKIFKTFTYRGREVCIYSDSERIYTFFVSKNNIVFHGCKNFLNKKDCIEYAIDYVDMLEEEIKKR